MVQLIKITGLLKPLVRHIFSIDLGPHVQAALEKGKPVVALESTIITHGMPTPKNIKTALRVEEIVKENGATPATIGVISGRIKVGLNGEEIQRLADPDSRAVKVSRRDLPRALAQGLHGGTTVAATMFIAHQVDIPLFVTGGIGGVHRGGETNLDVSADLIELGRTPIAVVCSGVKSILDIGRTLEVLETQGVAVATYGLDADFPAFYCRKSGFLSSCSLHGVKDAVSYVRALLELNLNSGMLIAVPVPSEFALNEADMENVILLALQQAEQEKVSGANITPFILKRVSQLTNGKALAANIGLIEHNAEIGAKIAVGLKQSKRTVQQSYRIGTKAKVTVVGGSSMDIVVRVTSPEFKPKAVFFTCMDSRMIPTRFTETCVGDMFVVRNAGNLIPHSRNYPDEVTTTEPAALELGCLINNIRHVIVCGHSDCKAMNLLYSLRCQDTSSLDSRRLSPLKAWMCAHATTSLEKYKHLLQFGFDSPMIFEAETPQRQFVAYIDPEDKFATEDKLSQINTLQQLQNIASYGFLKKRLQEHSLHIHALWFDIYTGDIYYFSRAAKCFVEINELSIEKLLQEVNKYYS